MRTLIRFEGRKDDGNNCAIGHDNSVNRVYLLSEMDADCVTAGSRIGQLFGFRPCGAKVRYSSDSIWRFIAEEQMPGVLASLATSFPLSSHHRTAL